MKADAQVAQSLYDRVGGAVWSEHQAFKVKVGKYVEKVQIDMVVKVAPPDTLAALGWLQNRRPDLWRKRMDSPPDPSNIPEDYQKSLNPDETAPDNLIF